MGRRVGVPVIGHVQAAVNQGGTYIPLPPGPSIGKKGIGLTPSGGLKLNSSAGTFGATFQSLITVDTLINWGVEVSVTTYLHGSGWSPIRRF